MNTQTQTNLSPDQELLERIQKRIRWDIRVSNSDLAMRVHKGEVILHGYFDEEYRHKAAISVIKSTEGVAQFKDESLVLPDYHRTDREIEKLILKNILTLPLSEGEWIDVHVRDGVVEIHGQVTKGRKKAFADRAAWELSGVRDCQNMIRVIHEGEDLEKTQKILKFELPQFQALSFALSKLSFVDGADETNRPSMDR